MKPSEVKQALLACIEAGEPVFLQGPPGVGKSDIYRQVAEETGRELRDRRLSLMIPEDLSGMPVPDVQNEVCRWLIPSFLPRNGKGILLIDEINRSAPLMRAACLQLILDRRINDYVLPDGWIPMAAGNRECDGAGVDRLDSAMRSRFVNLTMEPDLDEWIEWALSHGIVPEIPAFLRMRPGLIFAYDPTRTDGAFPCPRTWAKASNILKQGITSKRVEFGILSGLVGEAATVEFQGFLRLYRTLPDPDLILADPAGFQPPKDASTKYALCGALMHKATKDNFGAVCAVADKLGQEFSVFLVADIAKAKPEVVRTKAFAAWASRNQSVIL